MGMDKEKIKEFENKLKKTIENSTHNLQNIKKVSFKQNDRMFIDLIDEMKEILYENYNSSIFCLIEEAITFIFDEKIRDKQINSLKEFKQENKSKKTSKIKENKQENHQKLLDLSTILKKKVQNFNEKISYGDSFIDDLISGIKNNLENHNFFTKLLNEEKEIN